MNPLDRIEAKLLALRTSAQEGTLLPFMNEGCDFVDEPMPEAAITEIERKYQVYLPSEYRAFIHRFGDTNVGPGNQFKRVREGLTSASKLPFPLSKPFLGCCSPSHQKLSNERQWEEFGELLEHWDRIPKDHGVLSISAYGCKLYGVLILNGSYCGQVWMLAGDAAYYGPFGGSEALHDEFALDDWMPTETPREYSFFEWYENWLNGKLKRNISHRGTSAKRVGH